MATVAATVFTYSEWAERMDASGRTSYLINLQSQCNEIIKDMLLAECQSGNVFEFTQVTSLPTIVRRQYNQGVAPTQATVGKQVQTAVEYADTVRIDTSLARLNGNVAELRANEDKLHVQAMVQKIASDLFYSGTPGDPTQFTGFANLYNTITPSKSQIATNVINGGGTSSTCASLWLLGWGMNQIHCIFPNGLAAGLIHEDMGKQQTLDPNNQVYWAWTSWFQQNIGVALSDWRYGVRGCNIDVTLFGGGSQTNLISLMTAMVRKPPVMPAGVAPPSTSDAEGIVTARNAFYSNRTLSLALDLQAQNKNNVLLQMMQWDGEPVMGFRGVPVRINDSLLSTETALT